MDNLIGTELGKYQIESLIGEGGMAAVYRAHDSNLDRDVAVKVILPGVQRDVHFLRRFKAEARSLAKLSHPNIVKIHDFGEQGDVLYLVMEYLPEGTLKERLGKPIPAAEAAGVIAPIARALAFAHRLGLVHRDIKPSNILFTESGDPMLTDFGIARLLGGEDEASQEMIGTPDYMAPEQGLGHEASPASDMYALGEVFYEMLTGRRPFEANSPLGVLFKKAEEPMPDPRQFAPGLPDVVVDLLSEVLAKTPEDRPASIVDFASDLQLIQAGVEVSVMPPRTEIPPTPGPKTGPVYGREVCPKCGRKLPQKAVFCPYCSTALRMALVKQEAKQGKDKVFEQAGILGQLKDFARKAWAWLNKMIGAAWAWLNVGRRRWYALGVLVLMIAGIAATILAITSLIAEQGLLVGGGKSLEGRRIIFSSYGDTFAIMEDGVLDVYADSGQTGVLHQKVDALRDADFSPDDHLAVLDGRGDITLFDMEEKLTVGEIKTGMRDAEGLISLAGGGFAVVDVDGANVTVWAGDGKGALKSSVSPSSPPLIWALSQDGQRLAAITEDKVLSVWDLQEKIIILKAQLANAQDGGLAFGADGSCLALSSGEGLRVLTLPNGGMAWGQVVCRNSPLVFSADGSRLACVDGENVLVFSTADGEQLEAAALRHPGTDMVFNQQAGTLFAVYETGSVEHLRLNSEDLAPAPMDVEEEVEEVQMEEPGEDALSELLVPTNTPAPAATSRPTETPTPQPVVVVEPIDLKVNPADGVEIVFVPAGEFTMGSEEEIDPYFWGAEAPMHDVMVDDFWIYRTEVTNKLYADCVEAKACPLPHQFHLWEVDEYYGNSKYDDYPVLYVNWTDAQAYCRYVGGRLPYEAEWEKAARGTDERMFPWGENLPGNNVANLCDRNCPESDKNSGINDGYRLTSPVGSFPAGASPYGAYDMAGNVWEWVFDYFSQSYYGKSPYDNPIGPGSSSWRVIRGGAYVKTIGGLRTAVRYAVKPDVSLNTAGFRCVIENPDN